MFFHECTIIKYSISFPYLVIPAFILILLMFCQKNYPASENEAGQLSFFYVQPIKSTNYA